METYNTTKARANLYQIIDEAITSNKPIQITGKRGNAVLISEDNWRAIEETLYLLSIPGMRESIVEGMKEDPENCSEDPGW